MTDGLPSRSSFRGEQARLRVASAVALRAMARQVATLRRGSLRLSESSLACRAEARPKGERRLVARICPRWNPLTSWMQQLEYFRTAA